MSELVLPRYPVYVPSAGRFEACHTAKFLLRDRVPFFLVVQPKEEAAYRERFPGATILPLPWNNDPSKRNGLMLARNWIKDHATAAGAARHWQLDDNIQGIWRRWNARKIRCEGGVGLRVCEDFTDRFSNVAISGLNYYMFSINKIRQPPFYLNVHVYSCTLVNNAIPHRWRLNYNDDTDICLQVLADGWCTVLLNAFLAWKLTTMTVKGGNTDELYKINDGRLRMARTLERVWPHVVTIGRRFRRPQHVIRGAWRGFDTPLKLKPGVDPAEPLQEYGMRLVIRKPIQSETVRGMVRGYRGDVSETAPGFLSGGNPDEKPKARSKRKA